MLTHLAGLLPPLDAPHHMRASEWKPFREGLVLRSQPGAGSYVDIGLDRMAFVPQQVVPNTRVTLELGEQPDVQFMPDFGEHMIVGKVREGPGLQQHNRGAECVGRRVVEFCSRPGLEHTDRTWGCQESV